MNVQVTTKARDVSREEAEEALGVLRAWMKGGGRDALEALARDGHVPPWAAGV